MPEIRVPTTMRKTEEPGSDPALRSTPAGKRLADLLIEKNDVQQEDMDKALELHRSIGGRLEGLLVRTGTVSEELLLQRLAELQGAPYLRNAEDLPDGEQVHRFISGSSIKPEWFLDNGVLMWREDGRLFCIARDTQDRGLIATLTYFYPDEPVTLCLAASHQIDRLLEFVKKEQAAENLYSGGTARALSEMAEEAPTIEFVNGMLAQAVDLKASDIHIEPTEEQFAVRMRVDGVLHTRLTQPVERFAAVASRIKLISGLDIAERRLPQDGRMSTRIAGQEMDVRVSTAPCAFGESVVLRMLAKDRSDLTLTTLGMEADHLALFRSWFQGGNGIILVTGPTGSGKSTTLASALMEIDDGVKKLITVEDPVEHQMPNITQIQTHAEIGFTFARALRGILRQDPDVIMIGEIRDLETAEIAFRSAMTGHLVLSTVHTNDALSSFTRLIDMGMQPFLIAASVRGVQAQRLVRRACPECSTRIDPPADLTERLGHLPPHLLGDRWVTVQGCDACGQTGYSGRIGIYELVPASGELQDLVVSGGKLADMKTLARRHGHRTLLDDGLLKASHGLTTLEEVERLALGD